VPVVMPALAHASTYATGYSGSVDSGWTSTSRKLLAVTGGTAYSRASMIILANCCRVTGSNPVTTSSFAIARMLAA